MRSLWKRWGARMRTFKDDLTGTGKVFRFSLQQYFKSAATYVMLILMLVGSGASVLIMTSSMDRGASIDTEARHVYIRNGSPYALDPMAFPGYVMAELSERSLEDLLKQLDEGETTGVVVDVAWNASMNLWQTTAYTGEQTAVTQSEAGNLAAVCAALLEEGRYASLGVSPAQIGIALAPVSTDVLTESEFRTPEEDDGDVRSRTAAGSAYTILVFMLISFSTSFIVRAVVQEKSSKLVELLMVSVKPLALIAGKILAAMCLVVVGVLCAGLGLALSRFVLTLLGRGGSATVGIGALLGSLRLGGILAALVSIVLGYLSFSILAALSGAGSPGISETESAAGAAMLLNFVGYGIGMGTAFASGSTAIRVMSLIPFVSSYMAPYRFIVGDLSFPLLLVSWILQAAVSLLLMRVCAAVYGALLIHRGERVGLGKILKMMKGGAGA